MSILQKGLQYSALEAHISDDGSERPCTEPFSLIQEHRCSEPVDVTAGDGGLETSSSMIADAPLQASLSNINLALQNASIMASNAVYGAPESSAPSTSSASTLTGASASVSKKKKKEQASSGTMAPSATSLATSTAAESASLGASAADKGPTGVTAQAKLDPDTIELKGHEAEVVGCMWNPVQPILASASADSTVRLWNFPADTALDSVNPRTINRGSKSLVHVLIKNPDQGSDVTCLEWRQDGSILATGCYDGKARLWSPTGDLIKTLQRHTGPLFALKWSRSTGKYLLTGGVDGHAIIWHADTGSVRHLLHHHGGACLDVDWRSSTTFVTCSSDKTILYYDMSQASPSSEPLIPDPSSSPSRAGTPQQALNPAVALSGHEGEVNCVLWNRDGSLLASGSDDHTARLWRVSQDSSEQTWSGKCIAVLSGHEKEIYAIDWHPSGKTLATASFDTTVRLWHVDESEHQTVASVSVLKGHQQPVYAASFSACGEYLATGSLDESLLMWRVRDGKLLKSYSYGRGGVYSISWQASGSEEPLRLAASFANGSVLAFDFYPSSVVEESGDKEERVAIDEDRTMEIDDQSVEAAMPEKAIAESAMDES